MPLVKQGKITTDAFVHVPDGADLPGDGAILISAARFLEDAEALSRRAGETGVIWPNNRDLDDLVPYLDRLAVVALVFLSFRDGRAYSQARMAARATAMKANSAPPARCCATSSSSCSAPASTRVRGEEAKRREAFARPSSAIRCFTSRPAMAASPR